VLIVGLNAYHGDVAAAVIRDGVLVAALEEERFTRVKHSAGVPIEAIRAALTIAGASPRDVDVFAVARAKRAHLWPKLRFALTHRPGRALFGQHRRTRVRTEGLDQALGHGLGLEAGEVAQRIRHIEHHPAHLASAFYASPFDEATCCAIDAFGDFVSTSIADGRGRDLRVVDRTFFPHSLGLLYLAITQYLGFKKYGDEYKVMGLAPYGKARRVADIRQLVRLQPGGKFQLALEFFNHWTGEVTMDWAGGEPRVPDIFTARLVELLGPPRDPGEPVTTTHQDIAASLQQVFEESVFHVLIAAHERLPRTTLCLAGGCAMNSVANGKIRRHTPFRDIYIQPAAGDNGTALGAALAVWHQENDRCAGLRMEHGYWGTSYSDPDIRSAIAAVESGGQFRWSSIDDIDERCRRTARHIADGRVIGWFQGRMEWGARALGNRSILADPRRADMRDIINVKIKFRETFRPFAPSVLEEAVAEYFVDAAADPFMIQVYPVRAERRTSIPAVTHVDGSGRLQTVSRATNPIYWQLIDAFRQLTGVPVLLNTSFNENEPIVQTPAQALDCFLRTDMDVLVLGGHVLEKAGVPALAA
jgi:carbamoyltransferase